MTSQYLTPRRSSGLAASPQGSGSIFDLHRQVNRLFDSMLEPFGQGGGARSLGGSNWPQLEVRQNDDAITVEAELPGVKEDDVELTIEDGVLCVSGEKRNERQDENGYSERSYGRFERFVSLPSNVDEDACEARFRDGVLTVTIPKSAEKQRGRRIPLGGKSQPAGGAENGNDNSSGATRQQAAQESSSSSGSGGQQG